LQNSFCWPGYQWLLHTTLQCKINQCYFPQVSDCLVPVLFVEPGFLVYTWSSWSNSLSLERMNGFPLSQCKWHVSSVATTKSTASGHWWYWYTLLFMEYKFLSAVLGEIYQDISLCCGYSPAWYTISSIIPSDP
jgi:hypothetical protein